MSASVSVAIVNTRNEVSEGTWKSEPSLKEVFLLSAICYAVYLLLLVLLTSYWHTFKTFGDNQAYVWISDAIRHWNFKSIKEWQFFGLPYLMVAFSFLTHTSHWTAILVLSVTSGLLAIAFADRLWGGWIAGLFAVCSRDWMERTVIGGAEPLFLALVFGSFIAARREKWLLAAFLAAYSTTVRPMGIFALLGIGIAVLLRREYKTAVLACSIGLAVGGLYALPLRLYMGSSLANVHAYGQADYSGGRPFTYPFGALFHVYLPGWTTQLNSARGAAWIAILLLAVVLMASHSRFRKYVRSYPAEIIFAGLYSCLLLTYNSPFARIAFPRYVIPVTPFIFVALLPWLPKDRRLLWAFGLLSALVSAAETYGFTSTLERLRQIL